MAVNYIIASWDSQLRKFYLVDCRLESRMAKNNNLPLRCSVWQYQNQYNIKCRSYVTLRMSPLMHHSFDFCRCNHFFSVSQMSMLLIQTGGSRKAEHLFDGDRHGGDLLQRQERLSASWLSLGLGNIEVKAWLFSSLHRGSCYVCIQLMGS